MPEEKKETNLGKYGGRQQKAQEGYDVFQGESEGRSPGGRAGTRAGAGSVQTEAMRFKDALSICVRERPIESVLVALGGGLLLGRFRARPIEALVLAAGVGILLGLGITTLTGKSAEAE